MSTRCNVIIKDSHTAFIFYRHSDGYPECTGKSLQKFVKGYSQRFMRFNATQSAGWLVVHGHKEYLEDKTFTGKASASTFSGWKVGAYELTDSIHGDIEYLYTIDLSKRTLTGTTHNGKKAGEQVLFGEF